MIKKISISILMLSLATSCVSKKVFTELEDKYNKLKFQNNELIVANDELVNAKNVLNDHLARLKEDFNALQNEKEGLNNALISLKSTYDNLQKNYDLLSSKSTSALAENANKNRALLAELEAKETKLLEESARLRKLQKELNERSQRIDDLETLIAAKEASMQKLKSAISNALRNFEGKGLKVEHKNGKVYVSMENKLLFSSGSWAVGAEGKKAVIQLAEVLSENEDINVLIEGHTDNDPFSRGILNDNWDLSAKRATAIVRILQQNSVSPQQITAAGRSEYNPVDTNETVEGKAKNRRIEVVLAPNLDAVAKLLNE